MKRIGSFLLPVVLVVTLIPSFAMAKGVDEGSRCSLYQEIKIKEIVDVRVDDGKLYIAVIEEEPEVKLDGMGYGPCPSPYKYTTKKISRKELVEMRDREKTGAKIARVCATFMLAGLGVPGVFLGFLPLENERLVDDLDRALNSNKNSFTMKAKLKCVQGDMGSRGIVHHYQVESISIS